MAINLPESPKEIEQRAKTDVQRELPESNPFLKNSFLGALITGCSLRVFDFYTQLEEVTKQLFVQTATDEFLAMFGAWFGITRNPATQSSGNVVATGIDTSVIPLGTTYQSSDGLQYISLAEATIATEGIAVDTLTLSGSTATVTTVEDHNLSSFVSSTIADADDSAYNGTFSITVTGTKTFTYQITGTLPSTSPDTSITITSTQTTALVPVQSVDFGASVNQLADTALTLTTPIAGVDNTARVDFNELAGGTDTESDEDFRDRVIDRVQNPVANFNVAAIETQAREVPGVTRVFVFEITDENGDEAVGEVTVFFTRDDDDTVIPSAGEITTVKDKVLEIKPAHTSDDDVHFPTLTGVPADFTFTFIDPNTPTMQAAIETSLSELLLRSEVGVDLTVDQYRSAITTTIDRETGDTLSAFTLTVPSDDVPVDFGEIAVLGTITFSLS